MKRRKISVFLFISTLILIVLIQAQENESFFESAFDGGWAGFIRLTTPSGKRDFPVVFNLNCQGNGGIGFSIFPDNLKTSPNGFETYSLIDIQKKGKKLILKVETPAETSGIAQNGNFTHTFTLSYKKAKGFIKGNMKSTDPDLTKGTVFLYPQSDVKMLQKAWQGKIKINQVNTPVILQLVQKQAVGQAGLAQATSVTGSGSVGEDFGAVKNGSFDGTNFTGQLNLPDETVAFDFNLKGLSLKGRMNGATFSGNVTLKPAETKGKILQVNMVSPSELLLGNSNLVDIEGKNLYDGVIIHVDETQIEVDAVKFVSSKKIMGSLVPSENLPENQNVSLQVINPDGQIVELDKAFVTKMKEDSTTVSFAQDIQPVFNQNCALSGCHTGSFPAAGLNLQSGQAYNNIVNVPSSQRSSLNRITPSDPDNSYLIRKIKGGDISGSRMPLNRSALDMTTIATFETWVREGAQNN